ncbi:MAG: ATP-binding protein [Oscillospiraceae bacterium]|nr:ATP-binding protein [Oscillospiraceae bacterium]
MLNIISGKISRAVKTVIYGTEGVGKSTLASQFPDPLFLDVEGGTSQLDVRRIEVRDSWDDLLSIVTEVMRNPDVCRTLVIDTADAAETMCIKYILHKYNQKSIESFGYGKGYTYIGEEWNRLMTACDACIGKGINVTLIAHAKQRKIELPEQTGAFDHWEMKVSKQVAPLLKEWADLLLFCNYKTFVVTTDNNSKKAQGGKRVMYTSHNPVYDAKNRYGLPDELDLDFKGIAHIFGNQKEAPKEQTPQERLAELMAEAGIEEYQLRDFIVSRGKQSAETPVCDYPEEFVKGYCLRYWNKIAEAINNDKEQENE